MPKITYESLVIEVTRRCNMCCKDYCLRGLAQNIDMQKETIDKILDSAECINELAFTGGEPTLNIPIMEYTLSELKRRQILVFSFFIATNGKEVSDKFIAFLVRLNAYCYECSGESCGKVTLSQDLFHEFISEENKLKLQSLTMYSSCKDWNENTYHTVVQQGLAKEHMPLTEDYRVTKHEPQTTFYAYSDSDTIQVYDPVAVTATGYVYADCDYEYDWDNTKYALGNINKKSLYNIIINHLNDDSAKNLRKD